MKQLRNIYSPEECRRRLAAETFERTTISFYRYVKIEQPAVLRDELYREWSELGVLGRIYLAEEGINAQFSVPTHNLKKFRESLESRGIFRQMPFKIGLEQRESFIKLTIKVKKQIVADGLQPDDYDVTNVGKHLEPEEFNKALEEGAVVVDMRNHYESRIGRFEGAVCPDSDTFKDELPIVRDYLKGKEDKKILLYCTGGIRCEKASSYLKHCGFKDVNQLYGGIINYAKEVEEKGLESKFVGKNFVFDNRIAEKITDDVLTECDQCGESCDIYVNCKNAICNLLFIQCEKCGEKMMNCCSEQCKKIALMPIEQQRKLRKQQGETNHALFVQRQRPRLRPRL
ncbi:hypothetical protein COV82_03175 [Candidatus Peregrinibacteria bacterium CG11_big_fil_rev_8_21_14_0_20_46_8]|nr:MAG: hypothetical protein COV82_03175 [Candidatus Peregrinibacteria bacterium CG11_big_fil_rev_8_21_14_0_20_46_8]